MKNYIKNNLTVKLFLIVGIVLIGTSLTICMLFAFIMPASYVQLQNEEFEKELQNIIASIDSMDDAKRKLESFALQSNVFMELIAENGENYISLGSESAFLDLLDENLITSNKSNENSEVYKNSIGPFDYILYIEDQPYTLLVYGNSTKTINEITIILQNTIPWIIAVMILISLIIALFLSRFITKPIKEINESAKKISELSFDVHCVENRSDEIGELSKSINTLAIKLKDALSSLKVELSKEKQLEEKQRIFFAAASHELKTPLTIIKGNLEGMFYGYNEYTDKDVYISKSLRTVCEMQNLIKEILYFSELNVADYKLNLEHVNLKLLVEQILINYADTIELKKFSVILNLNDTWVNIDKALFTKALQNIISNALYYTPEKEEILVLLQDNVFQVTNKGTTIDSKDIVKVFEPFYRVEKSRNKQTGGSGLGLRFVKVILEQHLLKFCIVSDEDSVTFTIFL